MGSPARSGGDVDAAFEQSLDWMVAGFSVGRGLGEHLVGR
jgi:hypothetical protein